MKEERVRLLPPLIDKAGRDELWGGATLPEGKESAVELAETSEL